MENIISHIVSPVFEGWILILKIIFIALALFFLTGILFLLFRTTWLKLFLLRDIVEFLTFRPAGVRKTEKIWNKIIARLDAGLESEYKLAIIEADSLLNDILQRMGYGGETSGERLEKLTLTALPNIEEIKTCHQIRNNIVYDPDYKLSLDEARKLLAAYEQALRVLQAL